MNKLTLRRDKDKGETVVTGSMSNGFRQILSENKQLTIGLTSVAIVLLAIVVPVAVYRSFAATAVANLEVESGIVSSTASVANDDTNASAGKYVKFGAGSTGGGGTTILSDDFTGTSIDTTKWDVYDRISDQVNNEVNCVIPANVSISGGILSGFSKHEDHSCGDSIEAPVLEHYTSWQIAQKTASFMYGTVEVRAKEPGGTGIWPTIFLLGNLWQPSQATPPTFRGPTGRLAAGPRST